MKEKWDEIKALLKKNDRISFESLNDGASEEIVNELEKTISQDLPDSFKTFYKIHNGWSELVWPHAATLLSTQEIMEEWKSLNSLYGTKGQVIFFSTDLGDRKFAAASFEKWIDDFLEKIKSSSLPAGSVGEDWESK